jgi:hypothetical protein
MRPARRAAIQLACASSSWIRSVRRWGRDGFNIDERAGARMGVASRFD